MGATGLADGVSTGGLFFLCSGARGCSVFLTWLGDGHSPAANPGDFAMPSARQRSIAAGCRGSLVAAAHSSSWLPWLRHLWQ